MGTILVPLFAYYRPAAPPVQAAYAEGLRYFEPLMRWTYSFAGDPTKKNINNLQ